MNIKQHDIWRYPHRIREDYEIVSDTEIIFYPSRAYFSVIGHHIYFEGIEPLFDVESLQTDPDIPF